MAILVVILGTLAVEPDFGLKLVWSLIIPAAPLIFFLIPNIWVSLCPFAIMQSIPRRLNLTRQKELTEKQTRWLRMLSWGLLFTLVPARHLLFNHDALILLLSTLVLLTVAIFFGFNYKGLSGWCMGACPIRPVEMMYGQFTLERCRPEICTICEECNENCSRLRVQSREVMEANNARYKYLVFVFPGFVLGYYLTGPEMSALSVYGVVYGLSLASLTLFGLIDLRFPNLRIMNHTIIMALVIYYAFAIPGLVEAWALPDVTTSFMYASVLGIIALNLIRFYWYKPANI
ncbi:MAG: hypothetical protein IIB77_06000 [Proteobacteria bacterium]|nr:hypothetical protein [Pseudomonadota bacterium]